jgi:HAE1 family hydrophobic/amphiphilic exporter-1
MALLLSITFVFLLMGVLFESFLLPLSIITTIPMAFLGVYWTLWLTGTPLDAMGAVGMVVLVGVVVNNGIVYIDLVTRLRRDGTSRTQALIEAGGRRLRPILMTALTTIFGVLPMAMGDSSFVGMPYSPLGRVVAGGLAAGTLLTLFLLPFLYSVLDDARDTSRRWLAWVVGRSPVEASK